MNEEIKATCYDWCVHSWVRDGDVIFCEIDELYHQPDFWCEQYEEVVEEKPLTPSTDGLQ